VNTQDVLVEFKDFIPSDSVKLELDSALRMMHEELPYGSTVRASFSKNFDQVEGVIQVASPAKPFFAVSTATGVMEVTKNLVAQIRKRLSVWHATRFEKAGVGAA
jgi:hypothetical protein